MLDQPSTPMAAAVARYLSEGIGGVVVAPLPLCRPIPSRARGCLDHGPDCPKPGKRALVKWKSYENSLPPTHDVERWWVQWPEANIGVVTGASSRLVVVDVDGAHGMAGLEQHGVLPATLTALSGRPGGRHFYFQHPGGHVASRAGVLPGVDVRADGGLVVLPPSRHYSGASYRWDDSSLAHGLAALPSWLLTLLRAPELERTERPRLDTAAVLDGVPEGRRDEELFRLACKLRAADVPEQAAAELVLAAATRCTPPFSAAEALAKVRSAYSRYPAGSSNEAANLSAHYKAVPLADQMPLVKRAASDVLQAAATAPALRHLPLLDQDGYIVHGWGHLLAGYPKVGKTELLAASVVAWLAAGITVHWLTEESEALWALRLAKLGDELPGLFFTHALGASPHALLDHAAAGDEDIIILDTIRTLLGLPDECDNSAIARALVPWEARLQGRTRIYVHHDRKAGGDHGHGIAGGSAFLAVVDRALEVQFDPHAKHRRQVVVYSRITQPVPLLYEMDAEQRLVAKGEPAALTLDQVKARLRAALTPDWQKTKDVLAGLPEPRPSDEQARQALVALAEDGAAERDPPLTENAERRTVRWRRKSGLATGFPYSGQTDDAQAEAADADCCSRCGVALAANEFVWCGACRDRAA